VHVDDQLLPVITFLIAVRRKREDTQERYFYEWGINNIALLLSTPAVMDLSALFRLRHQQRHAESSPVRDGVG
jgi:hypothetical protein